MTGTLPHRRLAVAALALVCLWGCDPAARTRLLVTALPPDEGGGVASGLQVTAAAADAVVTVVAIVAEVADHHGLEQGETFGEPGVVATYGQYWDFVGDGHARTISVSVSTSADAPGQVEVIVDEWLAFGHSDLGQAVLEELRSRLLAEFGQVAVSLARRAGEARA